MDTGVVWCGLQFGRYQLYICLLLCVIEEAPKKYI